MQITHKKRSNRNEDIFIFNFVDEEDYDIFLSILQEMGELSKNEKIQEIVNNFISIFKKRVDDKYATDDYKLSGNLFIDEMCRFNKILFYGFYYSQTTLLRENLELNKQLINLYESIKSIEEMFDKFDDIISLKQES